MSISYLTQQSTLNAVLPSVIPAAQQQQNQFSSIITDITNLYQMMNNNIIPAANANGFSTQNVVKGSRNLNQVYRNTTGKTMMVSFSGVAGVGAVYFYGNTDNTSGAGTTVINGIAISGYSFCAFSFLVLNNNYYEIITGGSGSGGAISNWTEWY